MTVPDGETIAADRPRRRRWPKILLAIVAVVALLVVALTSGGPAAKDRPSPTALEVGAGRNAVMQLRTSHATPRGTSRIRYGRAELDGIGALATHGFRPDRLDLALHDGTLTVTGSHLLPLGRWLNIAVVAHGHSDHFPTTRISIGKITLPAWASRRLFDLAHWYAGRRGIDLPPLDRMVRNVTIGRDRVTATIRLPRKAGIVDRLSSLEADPVDAVAVTRLYCGLAAAQRRYPSADLVTHVHRVFAGAARQAAPATYNRAAFVALAMLLVDPRAGDLAGTAKADTERCRIPPVPVTIHGRADLPMHWSLSAALSASAGGQLARAMGEWKELADSLAKQSMFAVGDPSGFSFVDLSADRSGFKIAKAAGADEDAARIAAKLARATPNDILPPSLLRHQDSLPNAQFVKQYGSVDDPRYAAMVAQIDAVLEREGIH